MNDSTIDNLLKDYARNHLSPSDDERKYVRSKYVEVKTFLNDSCFRTGSFARHTAVRPLHDLDVIWVADDPNILDNPEGCLQQLAAELREQYKESAVQPKIEVQTHSVTLIFDDIDGGFAIDIVPAMPCINPVVRNKHGDYIYKVPEILKLSHSNRMAAYARHETIAWIYTDPKGYRTQATQLDAASDGNYRKSIKIVKGWRAGVKGRLGDKFKLKAFHAEQVGTEQFNQEIGMSVYDAVRTIFNELAEYVVAAPCIEDLAYVALEEDKYIDAYLEPGKTSTQEKELILAEIDTANQLVAQLSHATSATEIQNIVEQLLGLRKASPAPRQPVTFSNPSSPWANC